VSAEVQREAGGAAGARRVELRRALRAAEEECLRLRTGLLTLAGARLPGVHLVAHVAGAAVLLPGDRIAEIALVVACTQLPGAPPWVRGGFLWRGRPAVAVDLGARLGLARTASLEALLVILDGDPTVALVVDGVASLAEDPVVSEGDVHAASLAEVALTVPAAPPLLAPLLSIIPLQFLAYHVADLKGTDVDQPRNLAKSVTVE